MKSRCINLDWLEVHALEPIGEPHDANYFRAQSLDVREREYGTRVYREMFTIFDSDGLPIIEVRRNPVSQGALGIHAAEECHLRLHNRTCYLDNAAHIMASFIETFGYKFLRISRVDICMDFVKFDDGDDPQVFVGRYLRRKYSKLNQGRIKCYGDDTWTGQKFNSLSWGSPTSDIGTKLYNKTMELYDASSATFGKPYIRFAWLTCGLIDDMTRCTMADSAVTVWRLEFSIRSSVKKWFLMELNGDKKQKQSIRNTLDIYDGRERLLILFASLTQHYFHFKHFREDVRKDRCPDKVLFRWESLPYVYKVGKDAALLGVGSAPIDPLLKLANRIRYYMSRKTSEELREACAILIKAMEDESMVADTNRYWSHEDVEALRMAVSIKSRRPSADTVVLFREIKQLLHINEKTLPYF